MLEIYCARTLRPLLRFKTNLSSDPSDSPVRTLCVTQAEPVPGPDNLVRSSTLDRRLEDVLAQWRSDDAK